MPSSVNLGPVLEKAIDELVASGRYGSRSEVLREGARLVQEREMRLAVLDASLARGLADADAGRTEPSEKLIGRLKAKYQAMAQPALKARRKK